MFRLISISLFFLVGVAARGEQQPDPAEILRAARVNQVHQDAELDAVLRNREMREPFRIVLEEGVIQFEFSNPNQAVILKLGEEESELLERSGGRSAPVRPARFDAPVRGSGITYEDLSMRFLYWPKAVLLGEETIRTRRAYKIEVHPLRRDSVYGAARLWIDKETGALLKMEGYNWEGRKEKEFQVIAVQRINGQWFLRRMRVDTINPDNGRVTDRTYLEVEGVAD